MRGGKWDTRSTVNSTVYAHIPENVADPRGCVHRCCHLLDGSTNPAEKERDGLWNKGMHIPFPRVLGSSYEQSHDKGDAEIWFFYSI